MRYMHTSALGMLEVWGPCLAGLYDRHGMGLNQFP